MSIRSDATHWGSLARFFHWSVVVLLLVQAVVGLVMVELPRRPNVIPVYDFHKSLGLTILFLAVLRLAWRAIDRRPEEPSTMPRWQVIAARAGHVALYALLFAVPLSGWLFDSANGLRPLMFWGIVRMPGISGGRNKDLAEVAEDGHGLLFWLLVLVAAGHAAAALYHHFVQRDDVLRRMLPWRSRAKAAAVPHEENPT